MIPSRLGLSRRRVLLRRLAACPLLSVLPAVAQTPAPGGAATPGTGSQPPAVNPNAGPILVVGDSLSAEYGLTRGSGWIELLRQRLRERGGVRTVINASVSGDTSAGGRSRLDALLKRHAPSLVIIELGGNDALRGLDLTASRANLRDMISRVQATGAKLLLLGMKVPPNYGRVYGEAFERMYLELARETSVALVPFFLEAIADRLDYFQPDRIHPNESAQKLMLDAVWPALEKLLEGRSR